MHHNTAFDPMYIRKSTGDTVLFDESKLRRSLHRSGARDPLINQVMQEMRGQVYENMPTKVLYKMAYKLLKKLNKPIAGRYSLKQAMLELGPSGYPFESFFAEILKSQGYSTETGVILAGKCINHEVDVRAENDQELVLVECKYHPEAGALSDVKIPLYIHSRFRDLADSQEIKHELAGRRLQFQLVTNTRFSDDAMRYGHCSGLRLIAWDYPSGDSLRERIDKAGLHPVTCIGALSRQEKTGLLSEGIVLCRDLLNHPHILEHMGFSPTRQRLILKEATGICAHNGS